MNIDSLKIELIDWISQLTDPSSVKTLLEIKKKVEKSKKKPETKIFGSGKHLIAHISDDFNTPLEMFKDYQK